jgi:hypothetical protein
MLDQLLVFLNAHLASGAGNGLAVWGVRGSVSMLLYASTDPIPVDHKPDPNMYEPFRLMNDGITKNVEDLMDDDSAGSAGMALPFTNRRGF